MKQRTLTYACMHNTHPHNHHTIHCMLSSTAPMATTLRIPLSPPRYAFTYLWPQQSAQHTRITLYHYPLTHPIPPRKGKRKRKLTCKRPREEKCWGKKNKKFICFHGPLFIIKVHCPTLLRRSGNTLPHGWGVCFCLLSHQFTSQPTLKFCIRL